MKHKCFCGFDYSTSAGTHSCPLEPRSTCKCGTCGSPVTIEGGTTQYYVSENERLKFLLERARGCVRFSHGMLFSKGSTELLLKEIDEALQTNPQS